MRLTEQQRNELEAIAVRPRKHTGRARVVQCALVKLGLVEIRYGIPSYAQVTDLGRRVLGGPPLSDTQAAMLREIEQGTLQVRGRGAAATMRALRAKGLIDDANELTEAGQRACAADQAMSTRMRWR